MRCECRFDGLQLLIATGSVAAASAHFESSGGCLAIARLHFREIHHGLGDMVHIVGEDVQRDVGHSLNDVSVGQAGGSRLLEISIVDFAALHHKAACQFEDGVDLLCRSSGMTRVSDIFLGQADLAADEGMCAQAVGAHVTLGDDEGDLLPDLGVQAPGGERVAKVEIALQRGRRNTEDAE